MCLKLILFLNNIKKKMDRIYSTIEHMLPNMNLSLYVRDIIQYIPDPFACLVVAFIYMDRISEYNMVHEDTIHRLIAGSILLSNKYLQDSPIQNKTFSQIVSIPLAELNNIEAELWFALKCQLWVPDEVYQL